MTAKEFFTTGTRLFGVWEMLRLIDYALEGFDLKVGYYSSPSRTIGISYTHCLAYLVVSLYLLAGAPHVVNFFCPPPASPHDANAAPTQPPDDAA